MTPRWADAYLWRVALCTYVGDHEKARTDINRVIDLAPQWSCGYRDRGEILRRLGRFDQALSDCDARVRLAHERLLARGQGALDRFFVAMEYRSLGRKADARAVAVGEEGEQRRQRAREQEQ